MKELPVRYSRPMYEWSGRTRYYKSIVEVFIPALANIIDGYISYEYPTTYGRCRNKYLNNHKKLKKLYYAVYNKGLICYDCYSNEVWQLKIAKLPYPIIRFGIKGITTCRECCRFVDEQELKRNTLIVYVNYRNGERLIGSSPLDGCCGKSFLHPKEVGCCNSCVIQYDYSLY